MSFNLTPSGTPAYAAGKFSNALNAGSGSCANPFPQTGIFTQELWLQTTATTGTVVAIGASGTSWIGRIGTFAHARYGNGGAEVQLAGTTSIADGAWHHVRLVVDAGGGRLYVDGLQQASSATTPAGAAIAYANNYGVHTLGGASGFDWIGAIDEVAIFSTALTTGTTFSPPTAAYANNVAGIVALWHLDNDLTDSAGVVVNNALINGTGNVSATVGNWEVQASLLKTINAGAEFSTVFTGTSCTLNFDMTGIATPLPQITYRVDRHGPSYSQEIAATVVISVPSDTSDYANKGGHLLDVRVKSMTETQPRWSTQATAVKLMGIILDAGQTLSAPPMLDPAYILGDSIVETVRTVNGTAGNDTDRNDSGQAWSLELGRLLGVSISNIGFGGTGFTVTGSGGVPTLPNTYNLIYPGVARTFPANLRFILVMLGVNDGSNDITSAVTTTLNGFIALAPATAKIIVLRPFKDATHASQLQAAIAACSAPARCTYVDTAGFFNVANSYDGLHPYGVEGITHIAPLVANAVRSILAGTYGLTTRTASFTVRNAAGPMANLTNLQVSIFDDPTRAVGSPIRYQTLVGTTDANGLFTATYQSALPSGGTCGIDVRGVGVNMAINPTVT